MRIPTMPITHSDLMAITTFRVNADHRRSEATLGISYHAVVIGIRQMFLWSERSDGGDEIVWKKGRGEKGRSLSSSPRHCSDPERVFQRSVLGGLLSP